MSYDYRCIIESLYEQAIVVDFEVGTYTAYRVSIFIRLIARIYVWIFHNVPNRVNNCLNLKNLAYIIRYKFQNRFLTEL